MDRPLPVISDSFDNIYDLDAAITKIDAEISELDNAQVTPVLLLDNLPGPSSERVRYVHSAHGLHDVIFQQRGVRVPDEFQRGRKAVLRQGHKRKDQKISFAIRHPLRYRGLHP